MKRVTTSLIIIGIAAIVVLAGCTSAVKGSSSSAIPKLVPAPNIIGMTLDEAEDVLAGSNLKYKAEGSDGASAWVFVKSNWRVDGQDPKPDSEVTEGDTIKLTVTNINKEAAAAEKAEKEAEKAREQQEREAEEQAAREAEEAEKTAIVPDVTGMDADDAKTVLADAGLSFDYRRTNGESVLVFIGSNWTVVSQSPEAGERAKPGDGVILTLDKAARAETTKEDPINYLTAYTFIGDAEAAIKKSLMTTGPNRYGEFADEIIYSDGYVGLYCAYWSALEEVGKPGDRDSFASKKLRWQFDYTNPDYRTRFVDGWNSGGFDLFFETFRSIYNNEVYPAYLDEFWNG